MSCESQILRIVKEMKISKKDCSFIFINLMKAFDSINRDAMIENIALFAILKR